MTPEVTLDFFYTRVLIHNYQENLFQQHRMFVMSTCYFLLTAVYNILGTCDVFHHTISHWLLTLSFEFQVENPWLAAMIKVGGFFEVLSAAMRHR